MLGVQVQLDGEEPAGCAQDENTSSLKSWPTPYTSLWLINEKHGMILEAGRISTQNSEVPERGEDPIGICLTRYVFAASAAKCFHTEVPWAQG